MPGRLPSPLRRSRRRRRPRSRCAPSPRVRRRRTAVSAARVRRARISSTEASCSGVTAPLRTASECTILTPSAIAPIAYSSCDGAPSLRTTADGQRQPQQHGPPLRRPRHRLGGCRRRRHRSPRCASSSAASSRPASHPIREDGHAHTIRRRHRLSAGNALRHSRFVCMCMKRKSAMSDLDPAAIDLGLDTFGDVTLDTRGSASAMPRRSATSSTRRCSPMRSGCRSSAWGSTTDRSSRSRARRSCWPPPPRGPTRHPPRHRSDRALLRRPGARLRAIRHAGRRLARPCGGHPRPRLVHRVVPAVRLRSARLRGALRREARSLLAAADREARHVAGHDARTARPTRTSSRRPRAG